MSELRRPARRAPPPLLRGLPAGEPLSLLAFGCGFTCGAATLAAVLYVLRRELDLYRRARGVTLDFTRRPRL